LASNDSPSELPVNEVPVVVEEMVIT